ncbi:hypothetical protein ABQF26_03685 [Mycolicibacterium elephantis]
MPEIDLTNVALPSGVAQWPDGVGLGVLYHDGPPGPDGTANVCVVDDCLIGPRVVEPSACRVQGRPCVDSRGLSNVEPGSLEWCRPAALVTSPAVITHVTVWRGARFWSAELAVPVAVDAGDMLRLDKTTGLLDVTPAAPGDPTYVPVASTYPVGVFADWGIGFEVTSGAIVRDVAVGSGEGNFYGGGVYLTPMGTLRHRAIVTAANVVGLPNNRGVGCGVHGSDDEFTDGVFCVADSAAASNPPSCELFVKTGASITPVASSNDDTDNNTKIELRPSLSGGVWTYTVLKDGAATSCAWTDSEHMVTPGLFTCFAFQHRRVSGVELFSDGIRDFTAQDY